MKQTVTIFKLLLSAALLSSLISQAHISTCLLRLPCANTTGVCCNEETSYCCRPRGAFDFKSCHHCVNAQICCAVDHCCETFPENNGVVLALEGPETQLRVAILLIVFLLILLICMPLGCHYYLKQQQQLVPPGADIELAEELDKERSVRPRESQMSQLSQMSDVSVKVTRTRFNAEERIGEQKSREIKEILATCSEEFLEKELLRRRRESRMRRISQAGLPPADVVVNPRRLTHDHGVISDH